MSRVAHALAWLRHLIMSLYNFHISLIMSENTDVSYSSELLFWEQESLSLCERDRDVWKPSALPKQPACHTHIMFSSCDAGRKWCSNEFHCPAWTRDYFSSSSATHTCTFSPSWPHLYLLSLMSVIWAGIALNLLRPNRFSRSLPFHSYQSSSHRFPLSFSPFFTAKL